MDIGKTRRAAINTIKIQDENEMVISGIGYDFK